MADPIVDLNPLIPRPTKSFSVVMSEQGLQNKGTLAVDTQATQYETDEAGKVVAQVNTARNTLAAKQAELAQKRSQRASMEQQKSQLSSQVSSLQSQLGNLQNELSSAQSAAQNAQRPASSSSGGDINFLPGVQQTSQMASILRNQPGVYAWENVKEAYSAVGRPISDDEASSIARNLNRQYTNGGGSFGEMPRQ
jgi:outer membrane murein-binding lipoprotein Lpp